MFDSPLGDRRAFHGGRWFTAGVVLVMCLIVISVLSSPLSGRGIGTLWLIGIAAAIGISLWWSPLRPGRHRPISELGRDRAEVAVLWRPGCPYSAKLHRDLQRAHTDVAWTNIWRDPEAAAVCRRLNAGHEQVPTVIVVDRSKTRPTVIPATLEGIQDAEDEIGFASVSALRRSEDDRFAPRRRTA